MATQKLKKTAPRAKQDQADGAAHALKHAAPHAFAALLLPRLPLGPRRQHHGNAIDRIHRICRIAAFLVPPGAPPHRAPPRCATSSDVCGLALRTAVFCPHISNLLRIYRFLYPTARCARDAPFPVGCALSSPAATARDIAGRQSVVLRTAWRGRSENLKTGAGRRVWRRMVGIGVITDGRSGDRERRHNGHQAASNGISRWRLNYGSVALWQHGERRRAAVRCMAHSMVRICCSRRANQLNRPVYGFRYL